MGIQFFGVIYNEGYHQLNNFLELYPGFRSADNDYALSYNMNDFGWDAQILTVCTKTFSVSEKSQLSVTYKSGSTEDGAFYVVPKNDTLSTPVTLFVKEKIDIGYALKINFKWLQSDSFITTTTDINAVGEYYIAWVGRSNNSHPIIKEIKIVGG